MSKVRKPLVTMTEPVNIYKRGHVLALEATQYHIDLMGGWKIHAGEFEVAFKNTNTRKIIPSHKAKWPMQSYGFGKRGKRILSVDIPKQGDYEIVMKNQDSLKVIKSNVWINNLFRAKVVANEDLAIYVS